MCLCISWDWMWQAMIEPVALVDAWSCTGHCATQDVCKCPYSHQISCVVCHGKHILLQGCLCCPCVLPPQTLLGVDIQLVHMCAHLYITPRPLAHDQNPGACWWACPWCRLMSLGGQGVCRHRYCWVSPHPCMLLCGCVLCHPCPSICCCVLYCPCVHVGARVSSHMQCLLLPKGSWLPLKWHSVVRSRGWLKAHPVWLQSKDPLWCCSAPPTAGLPALWVTAFPAWRYELISRRNLVPQPHEQTLIKDLYSRSSPCCDPSVLLPPHITICLNSWAIPCKDLYSRPTVLISLSLVSSTHTRAALLGVISGPKKHAGLWDSLPVLYVWVVLLCSLTSA